MGGICQGFVREGDVVIVHSLDRLARNLDDLRRLVQTLTSQKVKSSSATTDMEAEKF